MNTLTDNTALQSVDSLLTQGTLAMPKFAEKIHIAQQYTEWNSNIINMICLTIAIILFLILLRRILDLFSLLFSGLFGLQGYLHLENSMRLVRERNSILPFAVLTLSLIASKYALFQPDFLKSLEIGLYTLCLLGFFSLVILLRAALVFFLSSTAENNSIRLGSNFLILSSFLALGLCLICTLFKLSTSSCTLLLYALFASLYLLYIIRRVEILSNYYSVFSLILYLCTLEFLPAALLIGTDIFL